MQRGLGGTAFEPLEERRDKELTLGPVLLTALVTGLLALCGICFFAGYAVGHRGAPALNPSALQAASPAGSTSSVPFAASNQPKPAAAQSAPPLQTAVVSDTATASTSAAPVAEPAAVTSAPAPTQPSLVHAALPVQAGAAQTVAASGQAVQPALVPSTVWMVQIASVAQQEDADVLVSALRRRGYNVSAHRDPADGQLHVRVGPFATHNDAATMRQKLMNDGYNAIIQP